MQESPSGLPETAAAVGAGAPAAETVAPGGGAEAAELAERLERTEAELAALRERFLRAHAELDNLRKRLEREAEQARRFANEALLSDLLPVLDSLERGLASAGSETGEAGLREGLELTLRQLLKALDDHGVKILDPLGEEFDPRLHQAVALQPGPPERTNRVLAVVQKGVTLRERLLRPALVIVGGAPEAPAA